MQCKMIQQTNYLFDTMAYQGLPKDQISFPLPKVSEP